MFLALLRKKSLGMHVRLHLCAVASGGASANSAEALEQGPG